MNTPKKPKRANPDPLTDMAWKGPSVQFRPIPDEAAAYLGHVVAAYIDLERRMIDVFRVILRIESREAATLAYSAIKAPKARWDIVKKVLENDHHHIATSTDFDSLIKDFGHVASARNHFVHGSWSHDNKGGLWLASTEGSMVDFMNPRKVKKSEFQALLEDMDKLSDRIIKVVEADERELDERWLKRSQQGGDR